MQIPLSLQVNGETKTIDVDPDRTLLSVVRDELGLTGAKYGCGDGICGACTLLVDGNPVQSCSVSAGAVFGSRITTVEGLAEPGHLHPLQAAFVDAGALQCGYCTSGMLMSALALLQSNPQPTRADIVQAMQDNICRCGSYPRIVAAIEDAAQRLQGNYSGIERTGIESNRAETQVTETLPQPWAGMDEGLFVAYPCPDLVMHRYGEEQPAPRPEQRELPDIGPWVHIDGEGAISVYVGKAEVGQNLRTTLSQIVAEELHVPAASVRVVLGDTGRTPFDIGTFGSRTTPVTSFQLWRAGAATRELLLDLAAANWQVDRATVEIEAGEVRHPQSGRRADYGALARDRQILRIAEEAQPVTPPAAWQTAGQGASRVDGHTYVNGQHKYAADQALPGLLYGKVLRPPAFQATLESMDASAAEAMAGVTVVREGDFVGVAAADELTATRARDAIRVAWKTTLQVSQPELFDYLQNTPPAVEAAAGGRHGPYLNQIGDLQMGLDGAHLTRQARYTVDYIAHVPLEPRAALAHWTEEGLVIWMGTQRPYGVRAELAAALGLAEQQVRVIVPDTGAGYGGKHAADAALEAAHLAKATGKPVKVVWTRQEEFTWAYFRPAGLIEIRGGADQEGRLLALEMHNYNSGAAGIDTLYDIPHQHIEYHPAQSPLRQGAYRALSSTANHFARESFVDELAHELGIDSLEIRLRNLSNPRLRGVLTAAAQAFGWGRSQPAAHHGYGLAGGFEKNSYVAACVEVYVNPANRQPKVVRVVAAYDCGAVVNPDTVRSQVEGALIQGLGGALFESVKFANGRILNPNFAGYRVPRFADTPRIEVILLDDPEQPSVGAGETPIVVIAPAIGSAIFQATGVRLRSLPLAPHGVQG